MSMKVQEYIMVAGPDGYVSEPYGFHDAIIRSVRQENAVVEIIFELVNGDEVGQKILIECQKVHFVFYSADPSWNVTFGLWLFRDLNVPAMNMNLPLNSQHELSRVQEILAGLSPGKSAAVAGVVLYAEPICDNELLVHCENVSAKIIN